MSDQPGCAWSARQADPIEQVCEFLDPAHRLRPRIDSAKYRVQPVGGGHVARHSRIAPRVRGLRRLLAELATLTKEKVSICGQSERTALAKPVPLQHRALRLLGAGIALYHRSSFRGPAQTGAAEPT